MLNERKINLLSQTIGCGALVVYYGVFGLYINKIKYILVSCSRVVVACDTLLGQRKIDSFSRLICYNCARRPERQHAAFSAQS